MEIQVKDISKIYGTNENRVIALNHASMTIFESDFISIMGPSGSGKSTLLHIISGLDKPTSGSVLYGSTDIHNGSDKQLSTFRRQKIGFIFQQYYLLPHLSVDKNVRLGADLAGNKNYREIIEKVGLIEKLNCKPSELSGGEQQRVCIARALAKNPRVLFLDEPTGALDEATGRNVLGYIADLQKERGFTMIMVTHNLNIAEMADAVIKMNSGIIAETYKNAVKKTAFEIGW